MSLDCLNLVNFGHFDSNCWFLFVGFGYLDLFVVRADLVCNSCLWVVY